MKPSPLARLALLARLGILMSVSLASVTFLGCGSDGDNVTLAEALASCEAYCDAYAAKNCVDPDYPTASACKADACDPSGPNDTTAKCLNAVKAYYDCAQKQADICGGTGCATQLAAGVSACPSP